MGQAAASRRLAPPTIPPLPQHQRTPTHAVAVRFHAHPHPLGLELARQHNCPWPCLQAYVSACTHAQAARSTPPHTSSSRSAVRFQPPTPPVWHHPAIKLGGPHLFVQRELGVQVARADLHFACCTLHGTGTGCNMCDCIHLSRIATAVGHIQLPKEEASAKIHHAAMPT